MTTEEKILLANTRAKELLTVLGNSGLGVPSRNVAPIDQLVDLLECAIVFAKYEELDLEATRREREYFRSLASNQG
jgi:hypothetical protein